MVGLEPTASEFRARLSATDLHPEILVPACGIEPPSPSYQLGALAIELHGHPIRRSLSTAV